jgi:hypothetical protein
MLATLLSSAAIQFGQVAGPANTMAIPNNALDRWPSAEASDSRWTMHAPSGLKPFIVATNERGQIAVRWATDPNRPGIFYVAMRQTRDRLEEADSRECPFGDVVHNLRDLQLPEILVPGSRPHQGIGGPPPYAPGDRSFDRVWCKTIWRSAFRLEPGSSGRSDHRLDRQPLCGDRLVLETNDMAGSRLA